MPEQLGLFGAPARRPAPVQGCQRQAGPVCPRVASGAVACPGREACEALGEQEAERIMAANRAAADRMGSGRPAQASGFAAGSTATAPSAAPVPLEDAALRRWWSRESATICTPWQVRFHRWWWRREAARQHARGDNTSAVESRGYAANARRRWLATGEIPLTATRREDALRLMAEGIWGCRTHGVCDTCNSCKPWRPTAAVSVSGVQGAPSAPAAPPGEPPPAPGHRWHIVAGPRLGAPGLLSRDVRPRPPLLPYRGDVGPVGAATRLPLNDWLRQRGRADLCTADDQPAPMASRVAELRERGGNEEQVRELLGLWEEWRRERRAAVPAPVTARVCGACGCTEADHPVTLYEAGPLAGQYRRSPGRAARS